ncbi:sister chromatid cohesion 1 protein 2-like isoform X1 [Vicia villosa]|uniref:sister chromatid cohesion 1 protein 2-like isoform X1 n=1 Tax=Vicia villosa TaxID=3911 RepID=UPI00273B07CA|nr:sister chromatid cohesion 1 protein 2-like isoform X1 [Vicia villosa]
MIKSKGFCSTKSPLWIAAFFFKQLKKAQIFDADISSFVDRILNHEIDTVSYRVLAYLLLGVVKIYSKKAEYMLHDCNKVLSGINKFLISTRNNTPAKTVGISFTIPKVFNLDAIELGVLEDTSKYHTAPPEQITLKEVLPDTWGFTKFSHETFDDFGCGETSSSLEHLMTENVLQSQFTNIDFEAFPSSSSINVLSQKVKPSEDELPEKSRISQEQSIDFSIFLGRQNMKADELNTLKETLRLLCEIPEEIADVGEAITFRESRERSQMHEEIVDVGEAITFRESTERSQMHEEIVDVGEAIAVQESTERSRDDESYPKENFHHDESFVVKESVGELIEGSIEEHCIEENLACPKKVSFGDVKSSVNPSVSTIIDVTPQSKFQGGSIRRPKPGATTSESMLIPTPDATECGRLSKKRKIVFDERIVLPNKELKKRTHDTSDLVSVRRPVLLSLLDKERRSQISRLPDRFNESLFPCHSKKLQSLFSIKKIRIPDSLKVVETPQSLDVSESQAVGILEHIENGPQIPPQCSDSIGNVETVGKLNVSDYQTCGSSDIIATAPETPPLCPNANVRSVKPLEQTEVQNSDDFGPSSPNEREQSSEKSDTMAEEFNAVTSNSYETLEKEQSFTTDEDLDLINEEISSSETENSKLSGWSERTRKVASYLHKNFQHLEKQKEADAVNLSQVSQGRSRKESARLFYEVLVLKTTNYVDVQQKDAYGDIAVRKLPKFDKAFGVDGHLN